MYRYVGLELLVNGLYLHPWIKKAMRRQQLEIKAVQKWGCLFV